MDDFPEFSTEELIKWLQAKYRRHGEVEDGIAAERLKSLTDEIEQLHEAIGWLSNDSDPDGPCWCPKGMSKDGKPFPHTSQCEEIRSLLTTGSGNG